MIITMPRMFPMSVLFVLYIFIQTSTQCDITKCKIIKNILECENAGCTSPYVIKTDNVTSVKLRGNEISVLNTTLEYPKVTALLDLSHNKISAIDGAVFANCMNLSVLDLSHNLIKSISSSNMEGLHKLKDLILSSNQITRLELAQFPFGIFSELKTLDLSNNLINEIDPTAFSELGSLQYLYLDNNKIEDKTMMADHFVGLKNLNKLNLNNNLLTKIEGDFLQHCQRLDELLVDNNALESIHVNAFRNRDKLPLEYIQKISFNRNKLISLQSMTFSLPRLEDLYLDGNLFSEISPGYFDGCTARKLSLQGCDQLTVVKNDSFIKMRELSKIDVSHCQLLAHIEMNAFGMNDSTVSVADFSSNHLEHLSKNILNWAKVNTLDLSHNPWSCDSRISWMTLPEVYPKLVHNKNIKCSTPSHLLNHKISELHQNDFRQWKEHKGQQFVNKAIMMYMMIGLVAVLLLLAMITIFYYRFKKRRSAVQGRVTTPRAPSTYQSLYNAVETDEPTVTIKVPEEKKKLMDDDPDPVEV